LGETRTKVRVRVAKGLEKLRVDPTGKMRFRTITGQIVERTVGHVFVEFEDEVAHNCCLR